MEDTAAAQISVPNFLNKTEIIIIQRCKQMIFDLLNSNMRIAVILFFKPKTVKHACQQSNLHSLGALSVMNAETTENYNVKKVKFHFKKL